MAQFFESLQANLGFFGILLLFVLEIGANSCGLYAASVSLQGFKLKNTKVIPLAAAIYSAMHVLGGYLLDSILAIGSFTGTGFVVGYFLDVLFLWATDKALKDFEITGPGPLFTGAFLMIFCWGVAWYVMLIFLGIFGVDLSGIAKI